MRGMAAAFGFLLAMAMGPCGHAAEEKDPFFVWYTLGELDLETGKSSEDLGRLDGHKLKVPGYVVPTEFSDGGDLAEFILVPAFGYCIHVPPPPANQMVYVTLAGKSSFTDLWLPLVIEGTLKIDAYESEYGAVSFRLEGAKILGKYSGEEVGYFE